MWDFGEVKVAEKRVLIINDVGLRGLLFFFIDACVTFV